MRAGVVAYYSHTHAHAHSTRRRDRCTNTIPIYIYYTSLRSGLASLSMVSGSLYARSASIPAVALWSNKTLKQEAGQKILKKGKQKTKKAVLCRLFDETSNKKCFEKQEEHEHHETALLGAI